jgi:aminoglycoside phosphotransferase (APT) family kinase protein
MNERRATPKMHADEVSVDTSLVRKLLSTQFPQWSKLPLRPMQSTGTDNAIFRLGDEMVVRLPRIHWAIEQIDKENDWLGRLAPHVSVSLPLPLAKGVPGFGYPYPWLVYKWLAGDDVQDGTVTDHRRLARDVAAFVTALGQIDSTDAPPAGRRGGPLAPHDEIV